VLLLLCSELTQHTPCYEALTTQAVRACFLTLPLNASAYKISQYYQTKLHFTENPVKTVSTAVKHTELQEYDHKLSNSRLAQKSKTNKSNKKPISPMHACFKFPRKEQKPAQSSFKYKSPSGNPWPSSFKWCRHCCRPGGSSSSMLPSVRETRALPLARE